MAERIEMSMDDVRNFTSHKAQQNEAKARETIANMGKAPAKGTPKPTDVAELGEADGF